MKRLKTIVFSALPALTILMSAPAADIELLPATTVRIGTGALKSDRVAIDGSADLKKWYPITNAAATGSVTFVNDPSQFDPMRFFRIADGDETFAIAGYVDAGASLGGIAGVSVTENSTGSSTTTDANGFFHFDQRFARTNLPVTVSAGADGLLSSFRIIGAMDSGTLCVLSMPYAGASGGGIMPDPITYIAVNRTIKFKVTGGTRAGIEFIGHFRNGLASFTGDVSGEGPFAANDALVFSPYPITIYLRTNTTNQIYLFPVQIRQDGGWGYFSGIPGTNGTLSGNGTMTWTNEYPPVVAPTNLNSLAFNLDAGRIQFTNNLYTITRNGSNYTGIFYGNLNGNAWNLSLTTDSPIEATASLQLAFTNETNGKYTLQWPGEAAVTGTMQKTEYIVPEIEGVPAPESLSMINITTVNSGIGSNAHYVVIFSGGTNGVFTLGGATGAGNFTYSPQGVQAHLRMNYTGDFSGDFDDMTLTFKGPAGSETPSIFSGGQNINGTFYQFTGTFTY